MSTHATPTNRELARLIAAARRAGTREAAGVPIAAPFFLALAIFLHASTPAAFLLFPIVGVPAGPPVIENKEESRAMRGVGLAVVASVGLVSGAASAQEAVQWRVEDGGNGHWYQLVLAGYPMTWDSCRIAADADGGYLATITDAAEHGFIGGYASKFPNGWSAGLGFGPVLGGRQTNPNGGPSIDWYWITGEPWEFTAWGNGEPNDHGACGPGGDEDFLAFITPTAWNDAQDLVQCSWGWMVPSYIIEWSADCNADGLVDYGQLLAGDLDDTNGNNIPDCCEADVPCNCPADLDSSGAVNGVDLAIILNTWGTSGGKYPQADIDGDGVVGGTDLALVLGAWGDCE